MKPIQKILCPTDCSAGSRAALEQAAFLAERLGARIHLLHVWHVAYHVRPDLHVWLETHGQQPIGTVVASEAQKELDEFVASLPEALRGGLTLHVLQGEPAPTIADFASREAFDLIVMGTHGRTGLAHLALGSVAEKVVRHASCPVLTLRLAK